MNDAELQNLLDYQAQMERLAKQPTVVGSPTANVDTDALQAYAKQFGLLADQPTVVDPSVDRWAPQPDAGGQAHTTLDFAIPGTGLANVPFAPKANPPPPPMPTSAGSLDVSAFPLAGPAKPVDLKAPDQTAFTDAEASVDRQGRINALNAQAKPAQAAPPVEGDSTPDQGRAPIILGGGGGSYVPASRVDMLPAEDRAMYTEGKEDRLKALDDQDPYAAAKAHQDAIAAREQLQVQAYLERKAVLDGQIAAQQAKAHQLAQAEAKANAMAADAEAEAKDATIDPDHFFASRSAFQSIAIALGVGLGTLAQAGRGGPNLAWDMIQQEVAKDIDAQKANLSNKRASSDSALKRALNATGNLDQATQYLRIQQLQKVDGQAAHYQQLANNDEERARITEIRDKIAAGLQDAKGVLKESTALQDAGTYASIPAHTVGGMGAGTASDAANAKNSVSVPRSDGKGYDDYSVIDPADRAELVEKSIAVRSAQDIAAQIQKIVDKGGATWRTDPTLKAEMDSLRGQLSRVVKSKTGDSSDKDREALDAMSGDPSAWLANGQDVLNRFVQNQSSALRTRIKVIGAEPVQRTYSVDSTGRKHPGAILTGQVPGAGNMPPSKPLVPGK